MGNICRKKKRNKNVTYFVINLKFITKLLCIYNFVKIHDINKRFFPINEYSTNIRLVSDNHPAFLFYVYIF